MKKLVFFAIFAFTADVAFGQNNVPAKKEDVAVIKWEASTTHDFGKIKQGVPVTYEFKFTSSGKVPVILTDARPSCGCTTPSWSREPVMNGGEGHVKATFNAQALGPFDKTITIVANVEGGMVLLRIKGEVEGAASKPNPNQ
ncbi:MAG: DUF1573 domain-containing protein [Bacteroidetes bacterium]|nr:DUF1573 domain-containing protein [Bacteroidota bacterium]